VSQFRIGEAFRGGLVALEGARRPEDAVTPAAVVVALDVVHVAAKARETVHENTSWRALSGKSDEANGGGGRLYP